MRLTAAHLEYRHGGRFYGKAAGHGRPVGANRAFDSQTQTQSQGRTTAGSRPCVSLGPALRAQDRNGLGRFSAGDGLLWHDIVESIARLATRRGVAEDPRITSDQAARGRSHRLFTCCSRLRLGPGGFWGEKIGPNPTDRRKNGSKHHLITDAGGVPLAVILTGANRHDVTQLIPLVDAIPPVAGKPGRPQHRPELVLGDRAYDSQPHRELLWQRKILSLLASRNTEHGSGLGIYRYVVEQTQALLHQFRRLRVRYDRRADIHEGFLAMACSVICWRRLNHGYF